MKQRIKTQGCGYPVQSDLFYSQIFKLVLPIVIQNLLSAAVSSADVVMLNYVGQSAISAVSLASQYASVLFMVFYGLGTGATMLCAQYYGKGDMQAIQVIEGIALRFFSWDFYDFCRSGLVFAAADDARIYRRYGSGHGGGVLFKMHERLLTVLGQSFRIYL